MLIPPFRPHQLHRPFHSVQFKQALLAPSRKTPQLLMIPPLRPRHLSGLLSSLRRSLGTTFSHVLFLHMNGIFVDLSVSWFHQFYLMTADPLPLWTSTFWAMSVGAPSQNASPHPRKSSFCLPASFFPIHA
ncbi:unnamed protein product [Gordionus sp. m RMFG-2023]